MSKLYIPAEIQCFWCNGHMREKGVTYSSDLDCVSYFCDDCGGIAHFARHDNKAIKSFTIRYDYIERKNRNE